MTLVRPRYSLALLVVSVIGLLAPARAEPIPCADRAPRDTLLIGRKAFVSGRVALDSSAQLAIVPGGGRAVVWHLAEDSPVLEVAPRCGEVALAELDEASCQIVTVTKDDSRCPMRITRSALDGAVVSEVVVDRREPLATSPNGHWLVARASWASGAPDGALVLLDTRTGAVVAATEAREDGRVAVRDDGLVAIAGGTSLRLARATGATLSIVFRETLSDPGSAVAFADDGGSVLAGDRAGRLYRWLAPDWRPAHPGARLTREVGDLGWLAGPRWLYAADKTALDDLETKRTPRLQVWDAGGNPVGAMDILFARQALVTRHGIGVRDVVRDLALAAVAPSAVPPRRHNGKFVETQLTATRLHLLPDGSLAAITDDAIRGGHLVRWTGGGPRHQSADTFVRRGDDVISAGSTVEGEPFAGGKARLVRDLDDPARVIDDAGKTVFTLPAESSFAHVRDDADVVVWKSNGWFDAPFFAWRLSDRKVRRSPVLPGALLAISMDGGRLVVGGGTRAAVLAVDPGGLRVVREIELGEPVHDAAIAGDELVLVGQRGLMRRVSSAGATSSETRVSGSGGGLTFDVKANLIATRDHQGALALYDLRTGSPRGRLWAFWGQSDVAGDDLALGWLAVSADGAMEGNAEGLRRVTLARGLAPRPQSDLGPMTRAHVLRRVLGDEAPAPAASVEPALAGSGARDAGRLTLSGGEREGSAEDTHWLGFAWRSETGKVPHRVTLTRAGETVWSAALASFEPEMRLAAPLSLVAGDNPVVVRAHDESGAVIAHAEAVIVGRPAAGVDRTLALQTARGALGTTLGAFSPDGRHFAMLSSEGVVRIWDVATGLTAMTLTGAGGEPAAIGWSPSGDRVAVRTTRRDKDATQGDEYAARRGREVAIVTMWTFPSGRLATSLVGQSSSPADAWLVAHDPYKRAPLTTDLWSARGITDDRGHHVEVTRPGVDGAEAVIARLPYAPSLAASADGRLLALVGSGMATVYETRAWTAIQRYAPDLADAFDFSFTTHDDGVRFAKGDALYRLSFDTGEVTLEPDGLPPAERAPLGACVTDFVICRGARFAAATQGVLVASQTTLRLRDRREPLFRWADQPDFLNTTPSLAVDPQGRLAAIVLAEPIVVDLASRTRVPMPTLAVERGGVFRATFTGGGTALAALVDDDAEGLELPGQGDRLVVADLRGAAWRTAPTGPTATAIAGLRAGGVIVGDVNGQVRVLDTTTMRYRASWPSHALGVSALAVSPREDVAATAGEDGLVRLVDVASGKELRSLEGHRVVVTEVVFSHDGTRLLSVSRDGTFRLWGVGDGRLQVIGVPGPGGRIVLVAADGSYYAPRSGLGQVAFRTTTGVVPYDELDLEHNRPDRALAALGSRDEQRMTTLRLARERRIAGRTLRAGRVGLEAEAPIVRDWRVEGEALRVKLATAAPTIVRVNGVPLPATSTRSDELAIPLSPGSNLVRITFTDDGAASWIGVERPDDTAEVRLFVLAVGVSRYAQAEADLKFAADDARHLATTLAQRVGAKAVTRVDAEATWAEVERAAHTLFADAREGDAAIVFIAGHGVNDGGTYYFAPHEMDFAAPRKRGVSFEALDGLFATTRARQRLLLMDTCFSGPIDAQAATTPVLPPGVIAVDAPRGAFARRAERADKADTVVFDTMRAIFADVSLGSGAQVIAAASGRQFAFEREGFGVFTGALLDALAAPETDADRDGELHIGEVQDAVAERVARATNGAQVPTSRRDARERSLSLGRAAGVLARASPRGSQWLGLDAHDVVYVRAPGSGVIERFQAPALTRLADLTPRRGFDATALGVSPDGRFELRNAHDGAHIVDIASGVDRLALPERHLTAIKSVAAFDAKGGLLVSWFEQSGPGATQELGRLDLETARMGPTARYGWFDARVAPDASRFVVLSESGVDVRDASARRIGGVSVRPESLANSGIAADLRHAITVDEQDRVTVWSVSKGKAIATWPAPGARGALLAIGPEARRVAIAWRDLSGDETLMVRDGTSGAPLLSVRGVGDTFARLAMTADGRHLVIGGSSGLRVYAVP